MATIVQVQAQAYLELRRRRCAPATVTESSWTIADGIYINRDTGKPYTPHHDDERHFIAQDTPRRMLAKGGEGSGKSVAGIIKTLERLRRGMSGIMGSPDFEHFKRSLWLEFARWCPWRHVIPQQRHRSRRGWEPTKPFTLTFRIPSGGTATLMCGGFEDPAGWEGPNVNFAHFDEARRHKTPAMIKVLDGRCRIPGPNGESPQFWLTTTPRKHWLYEMYGPWETSGEVDPYADFKREAQVITLRLIDNELAGNVSAGFTAQRRQSLTETEARVLLDAGWEDEGDVDRFLASMSLWDACQESLAPLDHHTPCVLAVDAGESSDAFATVIVSWHPRLSGVLACRYARAYVPQDAPLDFDAIERDIRDLVQRYAISQIVYDPFLLGQMMRRLSAPGQRIRTPIEPFAQGAARLEADKGLYDLIAQRRVTHDGSADLRQHISNADRKMDVESRRIRIVKRQQGLKIDLAVALSMACARAPDVLRTWNAPATGPARDDVRSYQPR